MTPRLEKLLRQRTLLREHLRWIEDEVAAEEGKAPSIAKVEPPADVPPAVAMLQARETAPEPASAAVSSNPSATDTPGELLPEPPVHEIHREVRSGCLLYFGIASAVVLAVVAVLYLVY